MFTRYGKPYEFIDPRAPITRGPAQTCLLPPAASAAVNEAIGAFNVSPQLCMFAASAAMAVASQGNVDVIRPGGGVMPTSDMFIYVGPSGSGKSLILRHFLRAAYEVDAEYKTQFDGLLEEHKIRMDIWLRSHRRALEELERARRSGEADTGHLAAQVDESRISKPEPPRAPRWILTEATKAGLLRTLGYWPAVSLVSDEGTKLLYEILEDPGFFNTVLNGEAIERDTARGTQRVTDPRSSIILASHPGAFEALLQRHQAGTTDNGFLPRASIFAPLFSAGGVSSSSSAQPELPHLELFNARLKSKLVQGIDAKVSHTFLRRTLRLSPAAEVLWLIYARELKMATAVGGSLCHVPAAAARSAEKALRRAARDHDFSEAAGDLISEATIRNAITVELFLLFDWCVLVGPEPEEPIEVKCARALHEKLYRHLIQGGMDQFEVSWLQPRAPKWVKKQHYHMALAALAARGMLVEEDRYRTRKATRWIRLNTQAILSVLPGMLV